MILPDDFKSRMKKLLGDEYESFMSSYNEEKAYGLRINTLKLDLKCKDELPFNLIRVPWAYEGFYADADEHPGRHPLHEAGAYYIQEPSAMSVVSLLEPEEGDIICDLCAAPGGKSTHIAERINGKGLLVSNEISPARAKILSQNIERFGITNAVVCNESPDRMAAVFPGFFDKIVVDAPCSGEGMFRKDETAVNEWTAEQVALCAQRQKMILDYADVMLSPGGVMVYSTCTFAPSEDEDVLIWFLRSHPEYAVEDWKDCEVAECIRAEGDMENIPDSGRVDFISEYLGKLSEEESKAVKGAMRLWPHKIKGEGHFAVRLRKNESNKEILSAENSNIKIKKKGRNTNKSAIFADKNEAGELKKLFMEIFLMEGKVDYINRLRYFGNELYLLPKGIESVDGIRIMRAGLHIASRKKNRFEPAHALAKAVKAEYVKQYQDCGYDMALKYLHGEVIECCESYKGWVLVGYCGCPLGWGKAQSGIIKNHYPKGLRI